MKLEVSQGWGRPDTTRDRPDLAEQIENMLVSPVFIFGKSNLLLYVSTIYLANAQKNKKEMYEDRADIPARVFVNNWVFFTTILL